MRPQDRGGTTDGGWAATCGERRLTGTGARRARAGKVSDGRTSSAPRARQARSERAARRTATSGEAAQLERGGDVHRAIQRAADDGPEQRDARTRARGSARGPGALGLGQALGVGREQRDHAGGERGGERGAKRQPAQGAQQLVGVHREAGERADEDQQRDLQPDHRPIHRRLDGEVALPERAEVAEPREHGEPVAGDEHVDRDDRHARRSRRCAGCASAGGRRRRQTPRRARRAAARAGPADGNEHQRGRGQRQRPHRAYARAGGVQGACETAVEERSRVGRTRRRQPPAETGAGAGSARRRGPAPPRSDAQAWPCRALRRQLRRRRRRCR